MQICSKYMEDWVHPLRTGLIFWLWEKWKYYFSVLLKRFGISKAINTLWVHHETKSRSYMSGQELGLGLRSQKQKCWKDIQNSCFYKGINEKKRSRLLQSSNRSDMRIFWWSGVDDWTLCLVTSSVYCAGTQSVYFSGCFTAEYFGRLECEMQCGRKTGIPFSSRYFYIRITPKLLEPKSIVLYCTHLLFIK